MSFQDYWEEPRVGLSREEELNRALYVDFWKVTRIIEEAYKAGYRKAKEDLTGKETHNDYQDRTR